MLWTWLDQHEYIMVPYHKYRRLPYASGGHLERESKYRYMCVNLPNGDVQTDLESHQLLLRRPVRGDL